ncbi:CoxL Aerobic-type carbon monoxide dehydrogenase, large subunit CoxL/CutL homologs [Burkholderiaceae bacterium]
MANPMRDDETLIRGLGFYVQDAAPDQALHVAFVRSDHAHAQVLEVDASAAMALPGVVAVWQASDVAGVVTPGVNPLWPPLQDMPMPLLAGPWVEHVGQAVAMVLAQDAATAQEAALLVQVSLEALPTGVDDDPGASVVHQVAHTHGKAQGQVAVVARADLTVPRLLAMAMEPRACVAQWQGDSQRLKVWLGSQTPARAQADIARALGLALPQVHLISPHVGGAFGSKASISPEDILVALAAHRLRTTVQWKASRSEEFLSGQHGRAARLQGQLAVDAQGHFLSLQAQLHYTLGAWLPYSALVPMRNAARILPGPYRVDRCDITGQSRRSHTAPVGIYRGAGRPEAALLMETLIDQAARLGGLDPVQMRLRNLIDASAMPYRTPTGETLDSGDFPQLLRLACERFGYDQERERQRQRRAQGELVGLGVALYVEPCGQGWESARVTWHADGSVSVASGSPDQGQGHATTFGHIAASTLGVSFAQVQVLMGDTDLCPPGTGALASRSTAIGGSAVLQACQSLRDQRAQGLPLPLNAEARFESQEAWASGCVLVRMSVDAATGQPRIERLLWVDDAGLSLQPDLVRDQLIGGAAQGIGQALMEQMVYDSEGQLLTGSLMDYAVPRADDMPPIELHSLHTPSPLNPLGAKGVGEAGCIGVPAAIMNAARDALSPLGEVDLQLPLRAEQLWLALQAKTSGDKT